MASLKIHEVTVTALRQIKDDRGAVFHYLKDDAAGFKGFGESYFSKINSGVIKGWKFHHRIYQNLCVPFGAVKMVLYDGREHSPTYGVLEEIILDDDSEYKLLSMPPGIWYSFKCISNGYALLSNIIDQKHEPAEAETLPLENQTIPYEWK